MDVENDDASEAARGTVSHALKLRSSRDRTCPDCGEVALAFAVADERARCRACGALD